MYNWKDENREKETENDPFYKHSLLGETKQAKVSQNCFPAYVDKVLGHFLDMKNVFCQWPSLVPDRFKISSHKGLVQIKFSFPVWKQKKHGEL